MSFEVSNISDIKSSIAQLSRVLRKKHSISRSELAEQLKVSRITIQNLETGRNVTIDTLLKMLTYFELQDKFNDFFVEEINNHSYDSLY